MGPSPTLYAWVGVAFAHSLSFLPSLVLPYLPCPNWPSLLPSLYAFPLLASPLHLPPSLPLVTLVLRTPP